MFVWNHKDSLHSAKDENKFFALGEVVPREHLASPERIKALVDAGALKVEEDENDSPKVEEKPAPKRRGRPKKGSK